MNHPHHARLTIAALLLSVAAGALQAQQSSPVEDAVWLNGLQQQLFGDQNIWSGEGVIALEAPYRAENAAVVPIGITAGFEQTPERYIDTIWLIVDKNPGPLAGKFTFSPKAGRADLSLRLRINAYSPVRAIARTNDGKLHMARQYVKASGGCAAPAGADLDAAMARLGRMKIRELDAVSENEARQFQLMVSHPNINGMQMDQVTQLYLPAHFVKEVEVQLDGEKVFSAETSFAISENPSFRFYLKPEQPGKLTATVKDTEDLTFTSTYDIASSDGDNT
jgi:sulfur-oxidizing protein SoxY